MVVGFDKKGGLHAAGMIWEYMSSSADQSRARSSVDAGRTRPYDQTEVVQRGFSVEVSLGVGGSAAGPGTGGKLMAEIGFGIGGGCFLDVAKPAKVATLGDERLWLLQQAAQLLRPDQMFVVEAVEIAHVAAATSGWSSKLQLAVDGSVDPAMIGIGNLAELQAAGHLNVSVKSGKVWRRAVSSGTPLFRAWKVELIPDVISFDLTAARPTGADALPLDVLMELPGGSTLRTFADVEPDELGGIYDFDDDV